jgi:hypothetical protein
MAKIARIAVTKNSGNENMAIVAIPAIMAIP